MHQHHPAFHDSAFPKRKLDRRYNVGDGFHVIAVHTESPYLKLKPKTASCKCNYSMVNVQTYGAGLWYTWFDRDLSVAGRVILRTGHNSYVHKLLKVDRPILRIPTLAIHLDHSGNQDGFKPNLETHLLPLLSMKPEDTSLEFNSREKNNALSSKPHHHRLLMQVLSDKLNCDVDDIVNIELNVCVIQPSCLGGGNNEFIFSGRLANLASSYCALRALIDSCESPGDLASENAIRMVALFDNTEVGSGSVQGAGAPTMFQAMRRIVGDFANNYVGEGSFACTIRQSFLVSADMAHGVHPNFIDKHVGDIPSVYRWEMTNRVVHAAARGGNLKILEELLPFEALVSAFPSLISLRNNSGETFLHKAVSGFNSYAFRRLDKRVELLRNMLSGKNFHVANIINVKNNEGELLFTWPSLATFTLPHQ
ncbi:probable aspartyl aminopeptidase [Glycine soja]|nr:probable aspartyl aminopeptidase [Glycine soja]